MATDDWNRHIGSLWAKLLDSYSISPNGEVIEIGPGYADKIGVGLATVGFWGTLYVVEPNAAAQRWVTERYRSLLDMATIIPVSHPVPVAGRGRLPQQVDALLMNHVLDDMLLHAGHVHEGGTDNYDRLWSEHPVVLSAFSNLWQRLLADSSTLHTLGQQVIGDIVELVDQTNPRIFGASQYSSWFLARNGFESVDRLAAELLDGLANCLGGTGTSEESRALLRRSNQDPDRWLVNARYAANTEAT